MGTAQHTRLVGLVARFERLTTERQQVKSEILSLLEEDKAGKVVAIPTRVAPPVATAPPAKTKAERRAEASARMKKLWATMPAHKRRRWVRNIKAKAVPAMLAGAAAKRAEVVVTT